MPSVGINENGMGEVFRLNLELGRFMKSFEIDVGGDDLMSTGGGSLQGGIGAGSVNAAALAEESHNLLAFGTSLGTVEFWDPRCRDRVGLLQPPWMHDVIENKQEITALAFHRSGLSIATGSSSGLTHIYDLRLPTPLLKKDQGFGYPIQDLIWLIPSTEGQRQSMEPKMLSSDKRIIKIWDTRNGEAWTSVEPAVDLHSVAWCKDSGMLLTANEGRQQHSFFIPQLGPAPKWCSFLDNLVEEMAEDPNDPNAYTSQKAGEVYDNYKFLTTEQLEKLNLSHLIGTTSLLRPYMHGFFVAQKLYEEAKIIADPFTWEEERAKQVKDKIERERETRIRGTKTVSNKVNKRYAEKLLEREQKFEMRRAQLAQQKEKAGGEVAPTSDNNAKKATQNLLQDPRFAKLFEDEEFAIDEASREFRALNPSTVIGYGKAPQASAAVQEGTQGRKSAASGSSADGSNADEAEARAKARKPKPARPRPQPQMRVSQHGRPQQKTRDRSFGSRATAETVKKAATDRPVVGEKEISYTPAKKQKPAATNGGTAAREAFDRKRRSASGNVMRGL